MTPIYEVKLKPKMAGASIIYIVVRVDDPKNIDDAEKCMTFVEAQFPFYEIEHIIEGYKK